MARKRQFRMVPVSTAICAAGGYTAQFTDQEEAKDALEFMPAILRNAGIRLDQAIFAKFCRRVFEKMVEHTARTGEWATWTKVMTSRLYILGRFEAPDATVPTENIELVVIPLEGFRLDLTGWSLQNVNAGNTLELKTISDQGGTDMGTVTGTKPVEIHGVNCPVDASKEDEGVWLSAKAKSGEEIVMRKLTVTSSDVKTVVVASPGALLAPFAKATFTVRSRAGNPEGLPQEKEIEATVKYVAPPEPIAESSDGAVKVYAVEDDAGESTPGGLLSAHGVLFVKGTGVTLQESLTAPGIKRDVECDLDESHAMRPGISIEQTADGLSVAFGSESGTMKNGEYPDAKLVLRYYKTGEESDPEMIEIPVGIKVTMGQEDWPE